MRYRLLLPVLALAIIFGVLTPDSSPSVHAQEIEQLGKFADDEEAPHFWHGQEFYILLSIIAAVALGAGIKPIVGSTVGLLVLGVGVAQGHFTPMLVLFFILQGLGFVGSMILMRR